MAQRDDTVNLPNVFLRRLLAAILMISVTSGVRAQSQEDADPTADPVAGEFSPSQNAALQYWRALCVVPSSARGTEWELANADPLSATLRDAEFLFGGSSINSAATLAIVHLRRGSAMPYCEWGVRMEVEGPAALLLHTHRAKTAAGLLLLSSRIHHSKADRRGAIDDLIAAWVFWRHIAEDRTIVSWINSQAFTERNVMPLAAAWIPDLETTAAKHFADCLDQIPTETPFHQRISEDRLAMLQWLETVVERDPEDVVRDTIANFSQDEELKRMSTDAKYKQQLRQWIDECRSGIDRAAQISMLPFEEFETESTEFQRDISGGNPLCRMLLGAFGGNPSILSFRRLEFRQMAKQRMLDAGLAFHLDGNIGLNRVQDPFGDGPFELSVIDGGFVLTSKLTLNGEPVSLTFGKSALPTGSPHPVLLIYDPDANSTTEIAAALSKAKTENKHVLLKWGFNGCAPCYALHRRLEEDSELADIIRDRYIVVAVDVTNPANDPLIKKYGADSPGMPHLTFLDAEENILANIKPTDNFYIQGNLDTNLIAECLTKWAGTETR